MANIEQQSVSTWTSKTFSLAAAGVIQVTAGIYLGARYTITAPFIDAGCPFPLGIWLMIQGSLDIVWAIRTGLSGTFSWTVYFIFDILFIVLFSIVYVLGYVVLRLRL